MSAIAQRRVAAATALLILLYLLQVVAFGTTQAQAASVTPIHLDGNPNCEAAAGTTEVLRLEGNDLQDGTYAVPGGSITVSNLTQFSFDWSASGIVVTAVFVKAGPGGWLYSYLPSGSTGDTNVGALGQNAISHITFCVGGETTTTTTQPTTTTTTQPTTTTTTQPTTTTTTQPTTTTTTQPTTTTTTQPTTTTTTQPTTTTTTQPPPPPPPPPPPSTVDASVAAVCVTDTVTGVGTTTITIVINPAGAATVNIAGQGSFTSSTTLTGLPDDATYTFTVTASAGFSLTAASVTSGSLIVEDCSVEVLGTTIASTTTTVPEVSAETLPFTGDATGDTLKVGLLALVAGGLLLFAVRGREEEQSTAPDLGGWSTF